MLALGERPCDNKCTEESDTVNDLTIVKSSARACVLWYGWDESTLRTSATENEASHMPSAKQLKKKWIRYCQRSVRMHSVTKWKFEGSQKQNAEFRVKCIAIMDNFFFCNSVVWRWVTFYGIKIHVASTIHWPVFFFFFNGPICFIFIPCLFLLGTEFRPQLYKI